MNDIPSWNIIIQIIPAEFKSDVSFSRLHQQVPETEKVPYGIYGRVDVFLKVLGPSWSCDLQILIVEIYHRDTYSHTIRFQCDNIN